jgi:glycerol-3-phosphate dehydrogenase (NAD(P)+)
MTVTKPTPEYSVLGAGNWGTTIAHLIGSNGFDVRLYARSPAMAREINEQRRNERYLPGLELSRRIDATDELEACVRGVPLIFMVIPSEAFREVAATIGPMLEPSQVIVHATKGLEQGSSKRMSQLLREETCVRQLGVLSGPNIAKEIMLGRPAGTVIASRFPRVIERAKVPLVSGRMRVYGNDDVVGVELGGTLKNIIAIAAGMATQMELGENAKALLITRGLTEMARLGEALGANPATFAGLSGVGDLIVTCASPLSRNHRVGAALARGETLEQAIASLGMVAEGVKAAKVAHELAQTHGIELPLMEGVYRVLHHGVAPMAALGQLMERTSGHESSPTLLGGA